MSERKARVLRSVYAEHIAALTFVQFSPFAVVTVFDALMRQHGLILGNGQ